MPLTGKAMTTNCFMLELKGFSSSDRNSLIGGGPRYSLAAFLFADYSYIDRIIKITVSWGEVGVI
jgi:hypothetical protein